jgi:hypothetical protein
MDAEQSAGPGLSRRSALKRTAGMGLLLSQVAVLEQVAVRSNRALADVAASSAAPSFSDIQFDIGNFINAPQTFNDGAGNVTAQFAPVFSLFQPLTLNRTPTKADQTILASALAAIEAAFPASPAGLLIVSVSYGLPYFNRLNQSVVKASIPTELASGEPVLIEAVPFDTDVVGGVVGGSGALFPGVKKVRFNVNVQIEKNDMLLHTRSDNLSNLTNANAWLQGSNNLNGKFVASPNFKGLYTAQTPRVQFLQQGMPQKVAKQNGFEFAGRMNPDSPPRTAPGSSPPPTPRSTPRSPEPRGSATRRRSSRCHGHPTAPPCTSAWTVPASTASTCPPTTPPASPTPSATASSPPPAPMSRPARTSSSCSS